ncbi:hypothetical protein TD95_002251 [Thielaviopsis punctulata]|uniref:DUF676 domain-containing protein n=1 Tax=Thielaviopsis punctulata TaxID=72032 RepID=A0A0F4ZII8_9PEZI|nr:hypothetical protein TD95_002251 [Thielaviopsis punctulata]
MLLLLQSGSVKLGEVVRFTVTYTPPLDRILPSPEKLYLRVRNTSSIALRAAFVHGPYSLSVAAYPATFDPNKKFANARRYGVPEFEPMVKAGGSWECELIVPEEARQTAGVGTNGTFDSDASSQSVSWIIEVASQVIFSTTASVGYEVVVARDRKSLNLSFSTAVAAADSLENNSLLPSGPSGSSQSHGQIPRGPNKGVFSRAIHVLVEDTAALWNKPYIPGWSDVGKDRMRLADEVREERRKAAVAAGKLFEGEPPPKMKKKKIHLVILTHGLHSNLGADLLFLKESIDAGARKARADAKARRAKERRARQRAAMGQPATESDSPNDGSTSSNSSRNESPNRYPTPQSPSLGNDKNERNLGEEKEKDDDDDDDDDDDEEVVVKGYTGNATRTERGIKFLGKRLARYVLALTYPDQPYHPEISRGAGESLAHALKIVTDHKGDRDSIASEPSHHRSTIRRDSFIPDLDLPYKITSISFLGHSLGGLIQTYAVAYIQKHSPRFFDYIRPINFVALATPFLGLSNENPMYVKFALDFGLVGRTGQDLGLTWRPPTLARSGWSAIVSNLGETAHKKVLGESQPESKPLLRILPTGPAHTALRKFRNRTVYSNVVNDGIVPLRTSCLLFLDWQGLGRVEKARRDAGLVETVVAAGWAELTGANTNRQTQQRLLTEDDENEETKSRPSTSTMDPSADPPSQAPPTPLLGGEGNQREVPQPSHDEIKEDDRQSIRSSAQAPQEISTEASSAVAAGLPSPFSGLFSLFKSSEPSKQHEPSTKQKLIYRHSQTLSIEESNSLTASPLPSPGPSQNASPHQSRVTTGSEFEDGNGLSAPPRTTFFESAHDIINPKVPDVAYLVDPSKRARTIFHDRVYHPEDIPPPLKKRITKRRTLSRRSSMSRKGDGSLNSSPASLIKPTPTDFSQMSAITAPDQKSEKENGNGTEKGKEDGPELVKGEAEADNAAMRVEEKIARAYHRGLSWRKVLVKLEPDAHNNIIVRRMFPNAYGWPVVHHVVESHFSDLASARRSVDNDHTRERAMDLSMPPNKHGRETTETNEKSHNHQQQQSQQQQEEQPLLSIKTDPLDVQQTASESLEAKDSVPDMQPLRKTSRSSRHDPILPPSPIFSPYATFDSVEIERRDSMTWSDHDWHDSEPDSDSGPMSPPLSASFKSTTPITPVAPAAVEESVQRDVSRPRNKLKKPAPHASDPHIGSISTTNTSNTSSSAWNWAEAIVGKRQHRSKTVPPPVKIPESSTRAHALASIPATPVDTSSNTTVIPAPVETPPRNAEREEAACVTPRQEG